MINFVFLVPIELQAKHAVYIASKRGRMGQPGKVHGPGRDAKGACSVEGGEMAKFPVGREEGLWGPEKLGH